MTLNPLKVKVSPKHFPAIVTGLSLVYVYLLNLLTAVAADLLLPLHAGVFKLSLITFLGFGFVRYVANGLGHAWYSGATKAAAEAKAKAAQKEAANAVGDFLAGLAKAKDAKPDAAATAGLGQYL